MKRSNFHWLSILTVALLLPAILFAQQPKQIEGKVTGIHSGAPGPGLIIRSGNSQNTAVTDAAGNFLIKLHLPDTLTVENTTVRFIVTEKTILPLLLRVDDALLAKGLQEVVVNTGYQRIPKERATGSFTTIDNKLLNQQVGTTVLDKLESITNGLYVDRQTTVNGKARILIRGLSTINGPASPLVILDDFPYDGDLSNINPNDVENITILKDAAAASIWGTRAGNGVIVITTKKGRYNQPMRVDFMSNTTVINKPDLRAIKNIAPMDYIGVERFLYNNGYYNGQLTGTPWKAVSPVVELFYQRDQGNITSAEAENRIAAMGTHNLTDELLNDVYDKGVNLQNALSLSGGTNKMLWNMSGGWDRNADQLNNHYNRYNLKTGQTYKLTSRLELTTGIDYTQSESLAGRQGNGLTTNTGYLPVYTQLKAADGSALPVDVDYRKYYADSVGGGRLLDWSYYPLTDAAHIHSKSKEQAVIANIGANYTLLKGLSVGLKYQYGRQVSSSISLYDEGSYLTRNNINTFTSLDGNGNVVYNLPRGNTIYTSDAIFETQNFRSQLNFNRNWSRHELYVIAGNEWRQSKLDNNSSSDVGYDPDILSSSPHLDALHPYSNFLSGAQEYMPVSKNYGGTINVNVSVFANAAYTYDHKYTFSASARRDASNIFGASRNDRWTPLWSGGLAWDISKENFYKASWLPYLKIRGTYGWSGNADPLRSGFTILKTQFISQFTNLPISQIAQYENRNLGWERIATANIGIDFSSRNDRISGSLEYYHKRANNLFGYAQVDYTAISTLFVDKNTANMKGHGFDFNINTKNIIGTVNWSTQLNLNFNRDKVTRYYLLDQNGASFLGGGTISAIVGDPVYGLYGYQWAGLDPLTGDPQGYVNGQVSKDYFTITNSATTIKDLKYSGPVLPTAVLSIGNTISWKKLSLNIRITGKFGHYFQRKSVNYNDLFSLRKGHSDYALRWQQPGDEAFTNVPSMVYPMDNMRSDFYTYSSILATKADFVRLQYINLGYDFKKVQVFINANNLGLLWRANKFGIDPEYAAQGCSVPANIAVGIKASF